MTEKTNGKTATDEQEQPKEQSFIKFVFSEFGSVNFDVETSGDVLPMQLLALSGWMEFEGKNALMNYKIQKAQEKAAQEQQVIEVPGIVLPK